MRQHLSACAASLAMRKVRNVWDAEYATAIAALRAAVLVHDRRSKKAAVNAVARRTAVAVKSEIWDAMLLDLVEHTQPILPDEFAAMPAQAQQIFDDFTCYYAERQACLLK